MDVDLDDWTAHQKTASEEGYELTTQFPVFNIYSNQPEKNEVYEKDMLEVSPEIINVLIAIFHNNGHTINKLNINYGCHLPRPILTLCSMII